ncbi:hypothetical protein BDV98DRAFT_113589 [Pterulicium gracile]|uniref:Uncharacterized protein n=1 Tax=Pterulicium gracile TaxID=1884261 RepID=A0A5C3QGX4_9AGAR|nr:hypothetical protein BDV98DRAFT_113589 [Pterula gracilis]
MKEHVDYCVVLFVGDRLTCLPAVLLAVSWILFDAAAGLRYGVLPTEVSSLTSSLQCSLAM